MTTPVSGVGPAATSATQLSSAVRGTGGTLGKDQFLQMLVAQLRNQDPLNPMDGQQFAAQLAQFSSVEQLMQINQTLGGQGTGTTQLLGSMNTNAALNTIGRTVTAVGDRVEITASGPAELAFDVGGNGGQATLRVLDAEGKVVATRDLGYLGAGRQGTRLDAGDLKPGVYRYEVAVDGGQNVTVPVQTYTTARVDGVTTGASGVVLTAGQLQIPFGSIVSVRS